jgi:hypothetical protein
VARLAQKSEPGEPKRQKQKFAELARLAQKSEPGEPDSACAEFKIKMEVKTWKTLLFCIHLR